MDAVLYEKKVRGGLVFNNNKLQITPAATAARAINVVTIVYSDIHIINGKLKFDATYH